MKHLKSIFYGVILAAFVGALSYADLIPGGSGFPGGVFGKFQVQGTAPVVSACGTGTPVIVGTDFVGEVTAGTSATGCVITFASAFAAAPLCLVVWEATPLASQSYSVSATALTIVQTSASANKFAYACYARAGG